MNNKLIAIMCGTLISLSIMLPYQSVQANEVHNNEGTSAELLSKKHSKKIEKKLKKMSKLLELNDTQKVQIKAILMQQKQSAKENRTTRKEFKKEVKSIAKGADFDEQKFKAVYNQYQPKLYASILAKAKSRHALMQVLTEEQQIKYIAFKKGRKSRKNNK